MIYKKEANFPYPVLTNSSMSYTESEFKLDIDLEENKNMYRFEIKHVITSSFLSYLLDIGKAKLILILQSKDSKFYSLENGRNYVEISKSRISEMKTEYPEIDMDILENFPFPEPRAGQLEIIKEIKK